ncbi:hypothetical protein RJ640_011524 [Escallonia rubra]|uniref:Uncharacterized protein n=1 Tax=Escallonia rubra TaxID=112253 RepID=A0AA88ULK8_9ASTE|nr:hypothetical protein RJ640_011524 [Escallonia rubra]
MAPLATEKLVRSAQAYSCEEIYCFKFDASSYHNELLEVLPNLYRVILEGSICHSVSSRLFSSSSKTALPPAWMQKCSKASLKSGTYALIFTLKTFLATSVAKKRSCSDMGRTNGPSVVMFVLKASPATAITSFESVTPVVLASSSSWSTHL